MAKRRGYLTLFVISLVFLAGWLALWLVNALTTGLTEFTLSWRMWSIGSAIIFKSPFGILNSWLTIGVMAVVVILIVVGLIVKLKQKVGKKGLYLIAALFLGFPAVDYCSSPQIFNGALAGTIGGGQFTPFQTGGWWFVAASLLCAVVGLILMIAWYILLLKKPVAAVAADVVSDSAVVSEPIPEEVVEETPHEAETPFTFDNLTVEPAPEVEAEPAPEEEFVPPMEEPEVPPVEEPVSEKESLADMLKEIIRDIVRDEISKNVDVNKKSENPSVVTGATFGGPLVVQYFNGGIQTPPGPKPPLPAPAPEPAKTPATPVAEPTPTVNAVVAPVNVVPTPSVTNEPKAEKKPFVRISFSERIVEAEKDIQDAYNELKNELLSYGIKSRVSNSGDTFRLHRKTYAKITVAGKSLKFYFALDPADYADSKMPIGDASHKDIYAETPLVFKVKSGLSIRRCKDLIADVALKDGLPKEEPAKTNWIKEIKAELKTKKTNKATNDKDDD